MHRLFGKSKPKVEAPTLGDASSNINSRMEYLDKQIGGLDNELNQIYIYAFFGHAAEITKRELKN